MSTLDRPGGAPRHLVLIDFDWEDADLLPELLRMPGVSVRLVAGATDRDAGVRVAELCGLPRSVELVDLTREIFDVALLSERSPRRDQIERLLRALGTPIEPPVGFVRNGETRERREPAHDGGSGYDAAQLIEAARNDTFLDGHDDVPGLAGPAGLDGRRELPDPEDSLGLERQLADWVAETRATTAVLVRVEADAQSRLCRSGPEDALLESLVQLAARLDMPHVLRREDGPQQGRLWGAWPFRTEHRRAVLAVAAADGESGRHVWESAVQSLCAAWSVADHERLADPPRVNILPAEAFGQRLAMALERHEAEGFRFALHRLVFLGSEAAVDALIRDLPDRLRGTDCLCRPAPDELLLLCAGSTRAYAHVRHRIEALWRQAWGASGGSGDAPEIADERLALDGGDDVRGFMNAAQGWFAPARP